MSRLVRGAVQGAVATAAMSVPMVLAGRQGKVGRQPPEAIVRRVGDLVGEEPHGRLAGVLGGAAHLAFGAGIGAVQALLPDRGAGPARGLALSLSVYAASYQGWVPVLGALPPASRDREDRQAVMAGAHVVFGLVIGALDARARAAQR